MSDERGTPDQKIEERRQLLSDFGRNDQHVDRGRHREEDDRPNNACDDAKDNQDLIQTEVIPQDLSSQLEFSALHHHERDNDKENNLEDNTDLVQPNTRRQLVTNDRLNYNALENAEDEHFKAAEVCDAGISSCLKEDCDETEINLNEDYDPFKTEVVPLGDISNLLGLKAVSRDCEREENTTELFEEIDALLAKDFVTRQSPFHSILLASKEIGLSAEPDVQSSGTILDLNPDRIHFQHLPYKNRVLHCTAEDNECDEEVMKLITDGLVLDTEENSDSLDFN